MGEMEFEKPIVQLRKKLEELVSVSEKADVDISEEIDKLKRRLERLEVEVYENLRPWDRVQIARHPARPTTMDYISYLFTDFFECHGDRCFGDDQAIIGGIASYKGMPVTIIGHQRGKDTKENIRRNFGMPHPEGYRKALRLMKQAEKFKRPIICFIDTKGAYPGKAAEERGQSEAIAKNLFEMAGLKVPILCIVIGEGGSGGALALGVGDKICMLENAIYSVISPEGAATILWKDSSRSKQAAESMRITAPDLKELLVIDEVITEVRGGAHRNVEEQAAYMDQVIYRSIKELVKKDATTLVEERYEKFKQIGQEGIPKVYYEVK